MIKVYSHFNLFFLQKRHNLQFPLTQDRKYEVNCTCILDRWNFCIWITFTWYSCNLFFIIWNSLSSVSFKVETWYLDKVCLWIRWISRLYRRSKVKHDDVIYELYVHFHLCKRFNSSYQNSHGKFFSFFLYIDNKVLTIILLNLI